MMSRLLFFSFIFFSFFSLDVFSQNWLQAGSDIDGEAAGDYSGWSVSFSSDGTILAIGAPGNDGNGSGAGHVRVYQYASGSWTQLSSDIDGEEADDYNGASVSLSSDGSIVAIGAELNDGNGDKAGHVRVYQYASGNWTQLGSDIDGEAAGDYSGNSVSLSSDGTILAIGAWANDGTASNAGHARVYQYASNTWTQLGSDIDGEAHDDYFGESVSLSSDGTILAIGAPGNDGKGFGHVRVYEYANNSWTQLGSDIDGEAADDRSGHSVSLSSDGTILAIGADYNDGTADFAGHVRVHQYASSTDTWTQLGDDIDGEAQMDNSGHSVSLSSDGTILAIGAGGNDVNETHGANGQFGHVRVYEYTNNSWIQLGPDIDGEAANDYSGQSVSLSSDGTKVAIGAHNNDGNGNNAGHVRVYQYEATPPSVTLTTSSATQFSETGGSAKIVASTSTTALENVTVNLRFTGTAASTDYVYENFSSEGLMLYMPFNGNANDESGNGNNGTLHGATLTADRLGNADKALNFDGNDWMTIPVSQSLKIEDDITMSFWAYFNWGSNCHFFAGTNDNPKYFSIRNNYTEGNKVRLYIRASGQEWEMTTDPNLILTEKWHHITYKNDIDSAYFYVDGVLVQKEKVLYDNNQPIFTSGNIYIGSENGSSDFLNGKLDEIRFYNRALSATEISDLYSLQFPLNSSLVGSPNNNIVIKKGTSSTNLSVRPISDNIDEDNETVIIDVLGVTNGTESGTQQLTFTITDDDDPPNVTLSIDVDKIPEESGETATVTATLANASSRDVEVTLDSSGTATGGGTDYTLSFNTITIAAGQTIGTATITVVGDQIVDDDETIIIDISSVTNATEASEQQVIITITEDVCGLTGGSNLSGVISSDKKLYKSCSPYILTGNLKIKNGVTLTIDPGVTLQMNNDTYILVEGTLVAVGTALDSITFDPFGRGIHFDDSAEDYNKTNFTGNRIKYAVIKNPTSGSFNPVLTGGYSSRHLTTTKEYNSSISSNNQVSILVSNSYLKDVKTNFNGWGGYNVPEETIIEKNIFEGGIFQADNEPNVLVSKNIFKNVRFSLTSAHFEYNVFDSNCNIERFYPQSYISGTAYDFKNNHIYARIQKFQDGKYLRFFDNTYDITTGDNIIGHVQYFTGNNILGGSGYKYKRDLNLGDYNLDVNAENNYWGTSSLSEVEDKIYDQGDDFNLGKVDVDPILTIPSATAPISKVKNLKITRLASSTSLTWDANTESDVAGYKLHYGVLTSGNAPPYTQTYATVEDLGNVTSKTLNVGLGVTDGITVTAYDSDADGTDDQIEGHESWFAEAEVISAPVGVNDSYQIAAGTTLEVDYSANISSPFASFPFDGSLNDVSGNHIGEAVNNSSNQVSFTTNRDNEANKALQLYTSSFVKIPHNDVFNFKDQNHFAISFWVKRIGSGQDQTFLSTRDFSAEMGWGWQIKNIMTMDGLTFKLVAQSKSGGSPASINYTSLQSQRISDLEWHHLVVSYDNNEEKFKMYLDKQLITSSNSSNNGFDFSQYEINTTAPLLIGSEGLDPAFSFGGKIDDLKFYNAALSEEDVKLIYNEGIGGVLKNDIDLDGDALTATLVQTTTNGTLTLQDNGGFKYVPNVSYSGNDNFTYKAFDGTYSSANTTVNISVSTPPTALNDTYSVDEDALLTVDAPGVLSNDTDAESDALTAVKLSDPSHGTLIFNADGSFTYDHDGGASTSDSFTYQASDGIGNSNTAMVTITIVTSDDAPVANPDAYGTEQDEVLIITKEEGVLKNDVDEEGDAMTVELVTDVTLGALTLDTDGSFNYTPPIGQKGIDTFEYKVKAAELFSNTTYATININGRPVISDGQAFNVDENKPNGYVIGLISVNDESSSFTWEILSGNQDNVFSIESNGNIKVNNSSALNYEQIQQVTLNLKAHDGSMWSDPKDVNISINNVQDMAITSSDVTHSYCSSGAGTGSITLVIEGEEGDINISWSNGEQNTLSITSLSSGTYSVTITDGVGQTLSENYTINLLPMYQEAAVCFITADFDDYTRNRIYVNVGSDPYNIDKYLIYREGIQADVYDLIGEIDPDVEGFVDTGVDNRTKSFRYKVAMRDKCGNVSDLSAFQETSHLSANPGIDGNINLQWTEYKGLEFSTYEIYRKVNDGDFDSLTSVSSNSHAYSDVSVNPENFYRYFVAILAEVECAPEEGGGINIEFDLDDMVYGVIDLNNPTDLKGKKVVRPRTNQFYLEATDDDGDGVGDDDDQCPDTPDGETVDANGCSDSQKDTDGDGVNDDVDQCPDTPTGETVDANGCSDSQNDADDDGDGVSNDIDQCPDTPTGETVDANGCSDSQLDSDGDGVTDDKDECPDTPTGELVYINGCSNSQLDTDGDGVNDDVDQCPDTPNGETADVSGCSDSQLDSDSDGVTDDKDECPDTPTGELVYINGCSNSQLDSDGDGVSDDVDQCPNTPQGENVDANGCPAPLFVESITFIEKVYPNPTDNEFIVELKDNSKVEKVEFIDFSGKVIVPNKVVKTQNRLYINVSNIIEGIYLLNITTDKEINKVKVVIER